MNRSEHSRSAGVGFKQAFAPALTAEGHGVSFIEIHAENYMGDGGLPHAQLHALRASLPLSVHGVALSIGGAEPLDEPHLRRLAALCDRYEPMLVSEHLAWSTHGDVWFPDLLPMAYTDESLARVVHHVDRMQEVLARRVLIENPSTYVTLPGSAIEEPHFLAELAARSGCGLLLDLNNAYVSCRNRGTDTLAYLEAFALERVEQIHVAGHSRTRALDDSELLVDDHGSRVCDDVWRLLDRFHESHSPVPTMIEWDTDVPPWPVVAAEVGRIARAHCPAAASPTILAPACRTS